jgi:ParB-like chromosome segregation protein Spo0J
MEYLFEIIEKTMKEMSNDEKISFTNEVKVLMHKNSPLKNEPVDCVLWVKNDTIIANEYNPNSVAPIEMELLAHSIKEDGYTQPIVTFKKELFREVVDGFHRNRVGKENEEVRQRIMGYLPVVTINSHRTDLNDRMAATIRHNRARGKHKIESMSNIVMDLKRRNWKNEKISKELGMEQDEVLRLCQITGLADMFKDENFSEAWDLEEDDK